MPNCPNGQMVLWLTLQPSLKSARWASLNQSHCTALLGIALYLLHCVLQNTKSQFTVFCSALECIVSSSLQACTSLDQMHRMQCTNCTALHCKAVYMWGAWTSLLWCTMYTVYFTHNSCTASHCKAVYMWCGGLGQIGAGFPASEEEHSHCTGGGDAGWKRRRK